ncbi:MAG TPA: hypothetical protein DCE41_10300 [Cytophagales bacterium]|nr:hypothetical protein [Cytophagales bacterium]HAA17331.1 hypothetical protein [Cytophagales bacterium]HAP62992.1 hypothetical protein [Cytophagales bacterium]
MEDQRLLQLIELVAAANKNNDYSVKLPTAGKNDTADLLAKEFNHLFGRLQTQSQSKDTEPASEIFMVVDHTLCLMAVSEGVLEAVAKPREEVIGQPLQSLLHKRSAPVDTLLQEAQKEKFSGMRLVLATSEGDPVTIPVTASELAMQDDTAKRILIVGLHEAQKMPREDERSYKQIERLTNFLHKTASEFKGPISSISGVVNLAKLESQDFKQHRYLDLVNKTVRQMDTIIRNIVTFCANMEEAVNIEDVDFALEITHLLKDLRSLEGAEMIKYNLSVDPKVQFRSDVWRLQIILRNLISNAIKYQNLDQEYPTVTISVKPWEGDGVRVSVKDNGPGIAKEYQDLIFDMFFKATDKPQGAGLGLFITKSVVEKLGGLIELESKTREGSEFTVFLPSLGA